MPEEPSDIADRFDSDYPQFPPGLQWPRWAGRRPSRRWGASSESLANAERVMAMGRESGVTTYGLWARNCAVSCLASSAGSTRRAR